MKTKRAAKTEPKRKPTAAAPATATAAVPAQREKVKVTLKLFSPFKVPWVGMSGDVLEFLSIRDFAADWANWTRTHKTAEQMRKEYENMTPEQRRKELKSIPSYSPEEFADKRRKERDDWNVSIAGQKSNALGNLFALYEAASDRKEAEAASALLELATFATSHAQDVARRTPELVRPYARRTTKFPVMLTFARHRARNRKPKWLRTAEATAQAVELGQDTILSNFSHTAFELEGYPARAYARAIVECLAETRSVFANREADKALLSNPLPNCGITLAPVPEWAERAVKLEPFTKTKETATKWLEVGIAMLLEQCPEFDSLPEWKQYDARWANMERSEKRNRILDLIRSSFTRLAA